MAEATVKIGALEVKLVAPESLAVRYEILGLTGTNHQRACWAALGACWRGKKEDRLKVRYEQCAYSPAIYGQKVFEELVARGMTHRAVTNAGLRALVLLNEGLPEAEEAEALEGFTEQTEGAETS